MSRIRPFSNDDEDEACDEGPQNVGQGCAEFQAVEEDSGEQMKRAAKFVLRMRKAGATYVKLGDIELQFGFPPVASKPE